MILVASQDSRHAECTADGTAPRAQTTLRTDDMSDCHLGSQHTIHLLHFQNRCLTFRKTYSSVSVDLGPSYYGQILRVRSQAELELNTLL